jgi:hypothetical protein
MKPGETPAERARIRLVARVDRKPPGRDGGCPARGSFGAGQTLRSPAPPHRAFTVPLRSCRPRTRPRLCAGSSIVEVIRGGASRPCSGTSQRRNPGRAAPRRRGAAARNAAAGGSNPSTRGITLLWDYVMAHLSQPRPYRLRVGLGRRGPPATRGHGPVRGSEAISGRAAPRSGKSPMVTRPGAGGCSCPRNAQCGLENWLLRSLPLKHLRTGWTCLPVRSSAIGFHGKPPRRG